MATVHVQGYHDFEGIYLDDITEVRVGFDYTFHDMPVDRLDLNSVYERVRQEILPEEIDALTEFFSSVPYIERFSTTCEPYELIHAPVQEGDLLAHLKPRPRLPRLWR